MERARPPAGGICAHLEQRPLALLAPARKGDQPRLEPLAPVWEQNVYQQPQPASRRGGGQPVGSRHLGQLAVLLAERLAAAPCGERIVRERCDGTYSCRTQRERPVNQSAQCGLDLLDQALAVEGVLLRRAENLGVGGVSEAHEGSCGGSHVVGVGDAVRSDR